MKKRFISLQKFKLTTGQIDRRQFVMSALAAGVVLPSALSMADKAMAAAPKKGGMMRYGVGHGSTTDSLDWGWPARFLCGKDRPLPFGFRGCGSKSPAMGHRSPLSTW